MFRNKIFRRTNEMFPLSKLECRNSVVNRRNFLVLVVYLLDILLYESSNLSQLRLPGSVSKNRYGHESGPNNYVVTVSGQPDSDVEESGHLCPSSAQCYKSLVCWRE